MDNRPHFSWSNTLAYIGAICFALALGYGYLWLYHPISANIPLKSIQSGLYIYKYRWIIYAIICGAQLLLLLVAALRIRAMHIPMLIKYVLYLLPIGFILGEVWLQFSIVSIWKSLNVPIDEGAYAIFRYIQKFNIFTLAEGISKLPEGVMSLKAPSYLMMYCYLILFFCILIVPSERADYRPHILLFSGKLIMIGITIIAYVWSAVILYQHMIAEDPFALLESLMALGNP